MALFNQSTIPWVTAVQVVADSAGASADTEMTNRAHRSLRAAFQFLGGKARWDFMRTESTTLRIIAPFSVTGVSATAVSGFSFAAALTGLAAGVNVITATATRDFYDAPSDWRTGYSVRLLNSKVALRYVQRRYWDRIISDEFSVSSPEMYDMFSIGGKGKIRLIPPPAQTDQMLQRYYRRFTLASVSSTATPLDIPEDYEEVPIAWAKWHFLTDKGSEDQATTWMSLAKEGIATMLAEQTSLSDEDLRFMPGHFGGFVSDNSTRAIPWDY